MRSRFSALVMALLAAGCQLTGRTQVELDPPRLLDVSVRADQEHVPTDPIRLSFNRDLDPSHVDASSVVVVPYEQLGTCSKDLACAGQRCHAGRCQRDPVSGAWLADLGHPPLSAARLAQTAPAKLRLEAGGGLVWEPLEPLAPHRLHALLVGPGLTDDAGARVMPVPEESRLVLREVFATASADTGRPLVSLVSPPDGAVEVPRNLKRALVFVSRPVIGVEPSSLFLKRADSRRLAASIEESSSRCLGHRLGTCFELRLLEELPSRETVELAVSEAIRDLRGRPVMLGCSPAFATSAQADHDPPRTPALRVSVSDRCTIVRLHVDEAVDLHLRPAWGATEKWSLAHDTHEVALTAPSQQASALQVELEDLAGNRLELEPAAIAPGDGSPRVAISEVLAHPAGPEPAQEFVELLNLDALPVDLEGWSLDSSAAAPMTNPFPAVTLRPGQLAVVVGPKFDLAQQDPPMATGSLLIRLPHTLGQNGLSNTGEPLVLRDPQGRTVSSYAGALPGPLKKGRSVERVDSAGCDLASNWRLEPDGRSSPGQDSTPTGARP